jgi:ubiquinone/menaquinone biosynthesis C-methylase UbiE
LRRVSKTLAKGKMLEIGAGTESYKKYFPKLDVISTDIVNIPHIDEIADVTDLKYDAGTFDYVLCVNVLEHIFEYQKAIDEIHRILKPGGMAFIEVPFLLPLHDIPKDYWRFTEFTLERLLHKFSKVVIKPIPLLQFSIFKKFVLIYFVEAVK